ncbi:MAG: M14 family metallopeptidase [Bdellovibrionales bacterium]|nr:M14 family metallopeptidase [Bdellovibrionales bacterium]
MLKKVLAAAAVFTAMSLGHANETDKTYWMHIEAQDVFERSLIADTGVSIETVIENSVYAFGNKQELEQIKKQFKVIESFEFDLESFDYPTGDEKFHNYQELTEALQKLQAENPNLVKLSTIGKSVQDRDIHLITISADLSDDSNLPAVVFMGGHHAREHISVEMPLMLAQHLASEFKNGNSEIIKLLHERQVFIIPIVNPDGAEHDIAGGRYKMWRKNRVTNHDGSIGVDLNRNYGFKWASGGASSNPRSSTYHGPEAFSEPETRAVREFVLSKQDQLTTLLSYHTFSELILFPWGHTYNPIADQNAYNVHRTMAETMSEWNNYRPQQSSDLYIASGDTTDWSYGELGLISFTFELDPKNMWNGGFYPGQDTIDIVFEKNIKPALYLIEQADNPYKVLNKSTYGVSFINTDVGAKHAQLSESL